MTAIPFDAKFTVEHTEKGGVYTFFCPVTQRAAFTTVLTSWRNERRAVRLAKEQARKSFNRCSKCGRWVSDAAYNIDEMQCVECCPRK